MLSTALLFLSAVLQATSPPAAPDPRTLPAADLRVDANAHEITIELAGIPLPAHTGHHGVGAGFPPVMRVEIPLDVSLHGFRVDVVDGEGNPLPSSLLHHFNLIEPGSRELFLPISRRVMAASKETGSKKVPWMLFGMPLEKGTLLVASAMLHNPTSVSYAEVRTRLVLSYHRLGRVFPLFRAFPFQLDVAFPVGDKSFTIPTGVSSRSYEARPSIPGRIVGVGGHLHELGTRLELTEVETGKVLWSAEPVLDERNEVVGIPIGWLHTFLRPGVPVRPDRTYRVTVWYRNDTGAPIEDGGMGVVAGMFVPDRNATWPAADRADPLYIEDVFHYLRMTPDSLAADPASHRH